MEKKFGRGDIIWIEFGPTRGHEQSGRRPALVISPSEYNEKANLMLACPITSKVKGYPFEVPINRKIKGVVLSDQIRSIDWKDRKAKYIETISANEFNKIKENLRLLIP